METEEKTNETIETNNVNEPNESQTPPTSEGVENTASRIWSQAKTHAREALDWGRKLSQVGKLKLDLARIQRDRQALYQELGRKTHELLKLDQFEPSMVGDLCTKIDNVSERIAKQERLVEEAMKTEAELEKTDIE